jgi:hypothetical protein
MDLLRVELKADLKEARGEIKQDLCYEFNRMNARLDEIART